MCRWWASRTIREETRASTLMNLAISKASSSGGVRRGMRTDLPHFRSMTEFRQRLEEERGPGRVRPGSPERKSACTSTHAWSRPCSGRPSKPPRRDSWVEIPDHLVEAKESETRVQQRSRPRYGGQVRAGAASGGLHRRRAAGRSGEVAVERG
jgi:hypothetical protein